KASSFTTRSISVTDLSSSILLSTLCDDLTISKSLILVLSELFDVLFSCLINIELLTSYLGVAYLKYKKAATRQTITAVINKYQYFKYLFIISLKSVCCSC